jgi:hypothetical protein
MATVVSVTRMNGPAGPVFDLVTSARFWPDWHPATRSVSGVSQRPYQLGDVIHERVHFAGLDVVVTWQVVEHDRPSRVVLQSLTSPARITYSLELKEGAVEFRRELEYDAGSLRQAALGAGDWDALMQAQSEEGVRRLKELVERILREEQAAAPGVAGTEQREQP